MASLNAFVNTVGISSQNNVIMKKNLKKLERKLFVQTLLNLHHNESKSYGLGLCPGNTCLFKYAFRDINNYGMFALPKT